MAKPKVFVTRMIAQQALDTISKETQMEVWPGELPPEREVLLEKVREADGILTLLTDSVDARLMDTVPNLKVISNYAVGYDNVDIEEASKRGIVVGNTPGVLTETTADMAFALLMASARRVAEGHDYTLKGHWKTWGPMVLLGQDIYGATLGIIGLGRIGAEMAKRAKGFNMRVLYFISVHVPFTPSTEKLIGANEFQLMKKNAVFINTARGGIVDQQALYEALRTEQIFAAGLDVTAVEPIPPDDPLLTLGNVIITPHIASASVRTRGKMAMMAAENLMAGIKGQLPPNCVNPEAFKR